MKYLFRQFLIISFIVLTENKFSHHYRCGTNDLKIKPKPLKPKLSKNKEAPLNKRRMDDIDEDGFKSFKIYVDEVNIKYELEEAELLDYEEIILNALKRAAGTLQNLLRIKPLEESFQFTDEELEEEYISEWDTELFGSEAYNNDIDINSQGIDLVIFTTLDDEMGDETIAAATPIYYQETNYQPVLGIVYLNSGIDFTKTNIQKYLESTLIHEMTHILGFKGDVLKDLNLITTKTDNEYGIEKQYVNSSKVIEVAKKYFNCPSIEGVELEDYGGEGTVGSHWEARILLGEYMNGLAYAEEVISEFTLALLEDTGIYKAHYYTGGLMRYGKNKGCDFVYKKCVNEDEQINPKFENEFFENVYSEIFADASCSSGRLSRTYNFWDEYEDEDIPPEYQYYEDYPTTGGWGPADYCPLPRSYYEEEAEAYYAGSCSGTESGIYGSQIYYNKKDVPDTNEDLASITGEEISDQSFCFLSSLYKPDIEDFEYYSGIVRANCYKIFCSERSLSLKINDDYIVCPRNGGKILVDEYEGYILCPDYNLLCSGTVICNDMFDCVDKNSEIKEGSYTYDYEINTSQNIKKANESDPDDSNNYELSDDGICPKYCKHCLENHVCIKCLEDYNFVGNAETEEIKCVHKEELTIGYLLDENDIYYKCIDNCDICEDLESCETCKEGFDYINNRCINLNMPNCKEYDEEGNCAKCVDNYAFKENDRSLCVKKETFDEKYYTKDGISYFLCSSDMTECDTCEYNSRIKKIECTKCKKGYVLSIDENKCLAKNKIDKDKKYFFIDDFSVQKCADVILNCLQCSNETYCDVCAKNTYFIDYNRSHCARKDEIYIYEYFLSEDKTTYLSCDIYNNVDNCIECDDIRHCNACKDGYRLKRNKVCKYIETDSEDENEEVVDADYGKNMNLSLLLYLHLFILIM